jgi:CheY-like chemotaxis protein
MAKTILVVDDDLSVLESYGRLLRRMGHRVLLSDDSERVRIDSDSLSGVDLLILDEHMPRTSGLTLLESLRNRAAAGRPEGPDLPAVILISALLSDDLRRRAVRLGVGEIIEKPVDPSHLVACVRRALEGLSRPPAVEERRPA